MNVYSAIFSDMSLPSASVAKMNICRVVYGELFQNCLLSRVWQLEVGCIISVPQNIVVVYLASSVVTSHIVDWQFTSYVSNFLVYCWDLAASAAHSLW